MNKYWNNNIIISRDVFETKYPNIFKLKDSLGRIYLWCTDKWTPDMMLWSFVDWVFCLSSLFDEKDLYTFEKELIFLDDLDFTENIGYKVCTIMSKSDDTNNSQKKD